jgi:anti-anti-sigma factor
MNIVERTPEGVTVLDLSGDLALRGNAHFKQRAAAVINSGVHQLIVNLEGVKYVSGQGLGALLSCHTALRQVGGYLRLLHPSYRLQHLLAVTGLIAVFETFDSESAAISSFGGSLKERGQLCHDKL